MASFNTSGWTPREHFEWRLENLKGAIKLAEVAIQALILTNGAAAAGLLTFYGTVLSNLHLVTVQARGHLSDALLWFGFGVAFALLSAIVAYVTQRIVAVADMPKLEFSFAIPSFILALLSAGAFVQGVHLAGLALR